jgi:hypothetical protein
VIGFYGADLNNLVQTVAEMEREIAILLELQRGIDRQRDQLDA